MLELIIFLVENGIKFQERQKCPETASFHRAFVQGLLGLQSPEPDLSLTSLAYSAILRQSAVQ
jgi:hypothetical protein